MGFMEIVKKIFGTIWNILKGIGSLLKDYMTSTWEKWDREAGIKPKKAKKVKKTQKKKGMSIDLDEYDEFHFKRKKKEKKGKKE